MKIDRQEEVAGKYHYYVLFMLALTYAFSFMDRQIVSILLGDLKAEFDLNDTQLGLLSGLAFAMFYTTLAIPIARYADRHNRINIISLAVFVWSLVTALCAAATNFVQLFFCRVGVGVGEAGGVTPSHSVISDYFNEHERPLAISLFSLGAAIGAMAGMGMGGLVAQEYGWRMAFLVAGLPGLALALAVKLTVKEPIRGQMDNTHEEEEKEPFWQTLNSLARNLTYRNVIIAHTLVTFPGYAIATWLPQVMLRSYDVSQAEVGSVIGLSYGLGIAGGLLVGGVLATHYSKRDKRWQLRIPVYGLIGSLPIFWFAINAGSFYLAAALFGIALFLFNMQHGPSLAVVQSSVKQSQRATAASLIFFTSNVFSLGLGPVVVGWISDMLMPNYGDASLGWALGVAILVSVPGAFLLYRASGYLK